MRVNFEDMSKNEKIIHLLSENAQLKEMNRELREKNKISTRRLRLIRRYLGTLSTESLHDYDSFEHGEVKANSSTVNVINHIVSTVPDGNVSQRSALLMGKQFFRWSKPGVRAQRRLK